MRIQGKTDIYDLKIILDVASDLIKMEKDRVYYFSINQDKTKGAEYYNPKDNSAETTFKNWDYVVHGTVFEVKELPNDFTFDNQGSPGLFRRFVALFAGKKKSFGSQVIRNWCRMTRCTFC